MKFENEQHLNVYEVTIPDELGSDFEKIVSKIPDAKIRLIRSFSTGERVLDWEAELKQLDELIHKIQTFSKEEPEKVRGKYEALADSLGKNGYHQRSLLPERVFELFVDSLEYFKQISTLPYKGVSSKRAISYSTPDGTMSPRGMRAIIYSFGLGGEYKDLNELRRMEGLRNNPMLITESVRRLAYNLSGRSLV